MSITTSYPGVYLQEIPSGVRTITGVATSIAAFVGRTRRGPENTAVVINSFADFERLFGGLWHESTVGFAVRDFFTNGGAQAVVVRLTRNATAAAFDIGGLLLAANGAGAWGDNLRVTVDRTVSADVAAQLGLTVDALFTLIVVELGSDGREVAREVIRNVSVAPSARVVTSVLDAESQLIRAVGPLPATPPAATPATAPTTPGSDGDVLNTDSYIGAGRQAAHQGLWALDQADLFNLLCLPPLTLGGDLPPQIYQAALPYCRDRRAMLLVDPPAAMRVDNATTTLDSLGLAGPDARNAALYFPLIVAPDPTNQFRPGTFVPCGAVAGVIARTDAARGVWKAPAGIDAALPGTSALTIRLTDAENGQLNPLGINCLRSFPVVGRVVWGARTLRGADMLADEYKYVPVRRLALFIAESLYRGTQWVVFEPNDEPLWSQIRLNVGAFLQNLFRQGAFEGADPRSAYFVKCDAETTTVNDRNLGRVNIVVGFAPLRPAEFVIVQIQQIAQAQA
ncbi:phage tail sheath family protein [Micromonospora rubida]|uniref:Phage tail sheath family protein n=1 Tax=Micromonospora rubida TaxID=2697657 RepID=A0ABW7SJ58_9ACTN